MENVVVDQIYYTFHLLYVRLSLSLLIGTFFQFSTNINALLLSHRQRKTLLSFEVAHIHPVNILFFPSENFLEFRASQLTWSRPFWDVNWGLFRLQKSLLFFLHELYITLYSCCLSFFFYLYFFSFGQNVKIYGKYVHQ